MPVTEAIAGTKASLSTTEWSLVNNSSTIAARTTPGVFQVFIDFNALAVGDVFRFRAYEKCLSTGTQRVVYETPIVGPLSAPVFVSPSLMLLNGYDFSIVKISGTDRTIDWSIRTV